VGASVAGVAFAFGVLAVALGAPARSRAARVLDAIAITASVALPVAMAWWDGTAGILQRLMFLVAYAWYASETLRRRAARVGHSPMAR
jgi:hypothetical protein